MHTHIQPSTPRGRIRETHPKSVCYFTSNSQAINAEHRPGISGGLSSFRVYFQLTENFWGYQVKGQNISPQIVTCPDDKVSNYQTRYRRL